MTIEQVDTNYERPNYFESKITDPQKDTIQLRQVPARIVDSLKRDDEFWYADHIFAKRSVKEKRTKNFNTPSQWMSMTTLVVIVAIFLGILIWYLFKNNIISRTQTIASEGKKREGEENIFDINYQREIERAVSDANYRLAVRLMFLRLLKNLSRKNIIQYKHERTNFDYLSQLYSTGYYRDFFWLARNYEYVWYGKFEVSAETFRIIKNEFENFDRRLS